MFIILLLTLVESAKCVSLRVMFVKHLDWCDVFADATEKTLLKYDRTFLINCGRRVDARMLQSNWAKLCMQFKDVCLSPQVHVYSFTVYRGHTKPFLDKVGKKVRRKQHCTWLQMVEWYPLHGPTGKF